MFYTTLIRKAGKRQAVFIDRMMKKYPSKRSAINILYELVSMMLYCPLLLFSFSVVPAMVNAGILEADLLLLFLSVVPVMLGVFLFYVYAYTGFYLENHFGFIIWLKNQKELG